ncbi:MAG: TraB/GumN family protein [Kofleriaceae bacterium]|nr:TraB/GumN family protein [Kofleriaceae bacterium]
MRAILLGLAVVVVVGCAPKPPACPVDPSATLGPPFLWRVQKAGGRGPIVWLYGTVHDAGIAAVPKAALDALAGAPRFASELGESEPDPDKLRELSRIKRGPGIDQQLATDDWWDLRDALRGKIREDDLKRVRPWYALILMNRRAAGKIVAMDSELATKARARHVPIDGLESWDVQLAALDASVTIDDLTAAIRSRHTMHCAYSGLRATYDAGDLVAMEPLLVIPRTAERMLYARNRAWLPKLEAYLANGGAFVAVGLGHMIGDQGLPALLTKAGYSVERVTSR